MLIREPAVAGRFYPAEAESCRAELARCFGGPGVAGASDLRPSAAEKVIGGIVPHAGWMFSGPTAAAVIEAVAARRSPATAVIFGAVHVRHGPRASVFNAGAWETPLGPVPVDERLAERIASAGTLFEADPYAHEHEHSIEVEVPLLRHLFPDIRIVPIMVPPTDHAATVGRIVGRICRDAQADAVFLGSSDFTHYGPSYGFMPHGTGPAALLWAKEHNDRRLIDLILAMQEEAVVPEARAHANACGAGAIAATIAASRECGATCATLLRHTTSAEVMRGRFDDAPHDAVGYAGIVFT